jgi:aminopeptidase N
MPGWFKDTYNKTEPLSTYLVAFIVSDYTNATADPTLFPGKPVIVWGPKPMMDMGAGVYAAEVSAKILAFLETYLVTDSKLLKMDKISLAKFGAGAMENWGLNSYR